MSLVRGAAIASATVAGLAQVTRGKNNMPPWGDLLKAEDIDALWAYVVAGEP